MVPASIKACAAVALCAGLGTILTTAARPDRAPLWPGARFSFQDRAEALDRGMRFIHSVARDPKHMAKWGHDLLWCFYTISASAQDPHLRRLAWDLGHERALEWRRLHPSVPPKADADDVTFLVIGSDSAEQLGVPAGGLKEQLRRAAARLSREDCFGFDSSREPPPQDIPESCERCGANNRRGVKQCHKCGAPLTMRSRYDVWLEALVTSHAGRHYGITLGAPYNEVIRWLPAMHPYRRGKVSGAEFFDILYAVTHVVYTLNDYNTVHIAPSCLPQEYELLRASVEEAMATGDTDMIGEYLDCLKTFGFSTTDPLIRGGEEFLLSKQNPDGSWGDANDPDVYGRYHPTWTAIDGLRDYQWQGYLHCPF